MSWSSTATPRAAGESMTAPTATRAASSLPAALWSRMAPGRSAGEQPGDQEDQQGHPFVGPAGRILDGALEAARIPRDEVYLTNAVKHFKWEPRGKRRLHAKPNLLEVHACHGWLEAELAAVKPD